MRQSAKEGSRRLQHPVRPCTCGGIEYVQYFNNTEPLTTGVDNINYSVTVALLRWEKRLFDEIVLVRSKKLLIRVLGKMGQESVPCWCYLRVLPVLTLYKD